MAKILLVEDDKSLREIYGVRLMAEGYEIVSAGDGEEALAMAIKERPELIVSDVMMPKISGFDMLDILRSTTETKDVKVIMMTALSSDDQRARGESLGADRYLVKSQVGIEDVVRTVHDVLGDSIAAAPATPPQPTEPAAASTPVVTLDSTPESLAPTPSVAPAPVEVPAPSFNPEPVVSAEPILSSLPTPSAVPTAAPIPQVAVETPAPAAPVFNPEPSVPPVFNPAPAPTAAPVSEAPVAPAPAPVEPQAPVFNPAPAAPQPVAPSVPLPQPTAPFSSPAPASLGDRVIQPLTNPEPTDPAASISLQMEQALNSPSPNQPGQPPVPPVA